MAPFWYLRNHAVEGRRSLEAVLIRDDRRTAARAKALAGVAVMAFADADLDVSAEYAEDALALHREFGDRKGVAYSAMLLGNALGEAQPASQMARAQKLLEESVDGFREVGDVESELRAAYNLATVVSDPGRERAILEDNMRRARALGLERDESMALGALAGFARREGRTDEAVSMLARCIRIERNIGDLAWTAINLGRLAAALASGGKLVPAACLLGNAEGLREKVGLRRPLWATEINDETHTAIRAELDDARFAEAFEEGRRLTIDDAITLALDAVDRERSTLEESETSGG